MLSYHRELQGSVICLTWRAAPWLRRILKQMNSFYDSHFYLPGLIRSSFKALGIFFLSFMAGLDWFEELYLAVLQFSDHKQHILLLCLQTLQPQIASEEKKNEIKKVPPVDSCYWFTHLCLARRLLGWVSQDHVLSELSTVLSSWVVTCCWTIIHLLPYEIHQRSSWNNAVEI